MQNSPWKRSGSPGGNRPGTQTTRPGGPNPNKPLLKKGYDDSSLIISEINIMNHR